MAVLNPILKGFYPDPSICRVGEDFYLVNSSFEYFPGVPLWHSKDLMNWKQIGNVLDRPSQLPIHGIKASDGVYAPTIRCHNGRFFMITTVMPALGNFLVHTEDPSGPWSEPVLLKQRGIDPSLYFTEDGRCIMTSNGTNWAPVRGAYQCEINPFTGEQLTPSVFLWTGTGGAYPEAPHLFKRGDFYYLMLAEGGTSECHMVTIARSRSLWGPFESCPHNPILTHRGLMTDIQASGHADFVEDAQGNTWAVFLGYRYATYAFHPLGRETFIAPVTWTPEGWPLVNAGSPLHLKVPFDSGLPEHRWPEEPETDDFSSHELHPRWVYARLPDKSRFEWGPGKGLQLTGLPVFLDHQASPVALWRRQQHFHFQFETELTYHPAENLPECGSLQRSSPHAMPGADAGFPHAAGIAVMIDNQHHAEVFVSRENGSLVLVCTQKTGNLKGVLAVKPIEKPSGSVRLQIRGDRNQYQLGAVSRDGTFTALATVPVRYLCTEVAGGYTGVMLGLWTTARTAAEASTAVFSYARYTPVSGA